jgi:TetR/AcrR family transcriptional regulator, transcriptional repressor for nem operon
MGTESLCIFRGHAYSKGAKYFLRGGNLRKSRAQSAATRERILSTATKMFLDKGLGTVGMRDIMAGASLMPGGFYRHFQSKNQLIAEASGTAFDQAYAMLEGETTGKSPSEAVERIVSVYLGQTQAEGKPYLCPLAMLGAELRHSDPQVRAIAIDGYQRIVQLIANHLTDQTRRGALITASGIVSTLVGAVTLAEIAPDAAMASAILRNAKVLIKKHILSEVCDGDEEM